VIKMHKAVSGLFSNSAAVDNALQRLEDVGYSSDDFSVITQDTTVNLNANKTDDIQAGAATGGVVGGVVGLLAGIGALTIPGLGALLIAGPLATALGLTGALGTTAAGAMTGALAGGLIGAFKDLGVDETKAKVIEERLKGGDTLLMVQCSDDDDNDVIKEIMTESGAHNIYELELSK
jgi:uncharacterized membrane protein